MVKRLGKGLDALIPSLDVEDNDQVIEVEATNVRPNPYQPRKEFDKKALDELAQSVKEHGVLQPLIVRKDSNRSYELVAGERRLRAAQLAGLLKVPVVVRDFSNEQVMEIALIENLQRENLNAIEIAIAYDKLLKHLSLTQEELAKKVGKSRPHVANFLRLVQLPKEIQDFVSRGTISMGHARALLAIEEDEMKIEIAKEVKKRDLSVRQVEELVKKWSESKSKEVKEKPKKDVAITQLEEQLHTRFGAPVRIKVARGKEKGKIEIDFLTNEELKRIVGIIDNR